MQQQVSETADVPSASTGLKSAKKKTSREMSMGGQFRKHVFEGPQQGMGWGTGGLGWRGLVALISRSNPLSPL